MKLLFSLFLILINFALFAQKKGSIQGVAKDVNTEEPIAFAKVFCEGTSTGAVTDIDGNYSFEIAVGTYTVVITSVDYETVKKYNVPVNSGNVEIVNFDLSSDVNAIEGVEVVYDRNEIAVTTDMITPLSVQKLTSVEIESNPEVNSQRLRTFNQLDFRIDKTINLKKVSFNFYIDVQNILAIKQETPSTYTFKRNEDNTGFATTDGAALKQDGSNAIPILIENDDASITPTIGIVFEF